MPVTAFSAPRFGLEPPRRVLKCQVQDPKDEDRGAGDGCRPGCRRVLRQVRSGGERGRLRRPLVRARRSRRTGEDWCPVLGLSGRRVQVLFKVAIRRFCRREASFSPSSSTVSSSASSYSSSEWSTVPVLMSATPPKQSHSPHIPAPLGSLDFSSDSSRDTPVKPELDFDI